MAIMIMISPPPTWSDATEILKNSMICCPSSAETATTIATDIDAVLMVRSFSASVC